MYYVPKGLQLNKFEDVGIPTLSQYVAKFGLKTCKGQYSGEDSAPMPQSKVDSILSGMATDFEYQKSEFAVEQQRIAEEQVKSSKKKVEKVDESTGEVTEES